MSNSLHIDNQERVPILVLATVFTIALVLLRYFQQEILVQELLTTAILYFACSLFVVLLHEYGHKYVAHLIGYEAKIIFSRAATITSLVVLVYSFSRIPLIIGNYLELDANPRKRLGKHRPYENRKQYGLIALGGTIASTIAITVLMFVYTTTQIEIFYDVAYIAGIHAISSLIPWELASILLLRFKNSLPQIHTSDGLLLLRWNVVAWMFSIIYIAVFAFISLLEVQNGFLISLVLAALAILTLKMFVSRE